MSSQPQLSPRAARTRAVLIEAGLELMVERPIDAIPIDDVVARAGVAKGSFFNHFADTQDFANAVAAKVRAEVEEQVTRANDGVENPVERIAGGMRVVAQFALRQPRRAVILLRSQDASTSQAHPLNKGLKQDVDAACAQGLLRPEAARSGVLYWLGLCQVLMTHLVERKPAPADAEQRLRDMMILGLTGLGVDEARAEAVATGPTGVI
jgi:AcrR family transcriptional regulator